jgi:Na+/melibiose symporter-like transporter
MENFTENTQPQNILELNGRGIHYITEMRKWTLFLSIVGFIGLGLMIIGGFVMVFFSGMLPGEEIGPITVLPLMLIAVIYFFPVFYLYQFSSLSKRALLFNDTNLVSEALRYLKMHFKYMGVLVIVLLIIYVIVGIFALLGFSMFRSSMTIT